MTRESDRYGNMLDRNFPFFLSEVWRAIQLPEPAAVQYDMADWLANGPRRRGIKAFRGVSKTWVTIAYILFCLRRCPNERILLSSESSVHSQKSLHMARSWIDAIPFLNHLKPVPNSRQRDSATQFDAGPSRWDRVSSFSAIGIRGMLAGNRGSIILGDDVETKENTLTKSQRVLLRERVMEFESILLPPDKNADYLCSDIIYLGTPHHETESLYDYLPECGYHFRTWPAEYPVGSERARIKFLAPSIEKAMESGAKKPGDPMWPERFTRDELAGRRYAQKTGYLHQFMLISGLAEDEVYPLKQRDLICYPCAPRIAPISLAWGMAGPRGSTLVESIPSVGFGTDALYGPIMVSETTARYMGTKAWIDPASTGKDELAYAIVGYLNGYLFLKRVNGLKGGTSMVNLETIAQDFRYWNVQEVCGEKNFGGEMLLQLLRPVLSRLFITSDPKGPIGNEADENRRRDESWSCAILDPVHNTIQKEQRIIATLEPVMNQHRLVVDMKVAADKVFMDQLVRITHERGCLQHDDRLDAVAGAVGLWREYMDVDPVKMAQRHDKGEFEKMLKDYSNWCKPTPSVWAPTRPMPKRPDGNPSVTTGLRRI